MPNDIALVDYYAKRAGEYERIYEKPERQNDLAVLKKLCAQTFAGRDILEIACGTGYWTQVVSQTAKSIIATDISDEVLQIARTKKYGCETRFQKEDAFNLAVPSPTKFTAGLAMAWWSHLRRSEIKSFLSNLHRHFSSGALLAFMDNRFVPGSNTPISRTDDEGNTYQVRTLDNGKQHEILKNFPTETEIRNLLENLAVEIRWTGLPYYWFLTYRLK
jgi:demethylmenaquinone methyltransferase/2-methoxy-6-polyprenyl-1,4-benzoquinol methylase